MRILSKLSKHYVLLLITVGLIVYLNSFFNDFVLDDFDLLVNNLPLHSFSNLFTFFTGSIWNSGGASGLVGQYYRPLTTASLSLLYTMFGGSTFPFHVVQTFIHIANSILFFVILKKFTNRTLALLLSLIFLVHPVNVEAVGYIASFGDVLYAFFGLMAVWIILRKQTSPKQITLIYLLLFFSLLSKESGVIFLLAVIWIFFYQKKHMVLHIISSSTLIAIYAILRVGLGHILILSNRGYPMMRLNLWQRLLNVPAIFWFYVKTFLFPKDLITAQNWVIHKPTFFSFYLPLLLMLVFSAAVLSLVITVYKHHRTSFMPLITFLILFAAGLGVVMQLSPLTSTVSDRWFYVPMIGLLGFIGITLQLVPKKWHQLAPYATALTLLLIVPALSIRTMIRNTDWRNEYVLAKHDLPLSPNNFLLENVYGYELMNRGQLTLAKQHLQKSVSIAPYYWINWNNLGAVESRIGMTTNNKQAIKNSEAYFQQSISKGQYYLAYENLAGTLYFYESPQRTRDFSKKALQVLPYNSKIWLILGLSEYKLRDKQNALTAVANSYTLSPDSLTANIYQTMQNDGKIDLKPGI